MENPDQALEAARRAGIDLSLVEVNLKLTVKERWEQHDSALNFALKLRSAKEAADARLRTTPRPTG